MDPLLQDVLDQPRALAALLEAGAGTADREAAMRACRAAEHILVSGMGASYYAAYPAFLRWLAGGSRVSWIEAGELLHFAPEALRAGTVLVLVSQSGRSAEVTRLLDAKGRATVIGVTNDPHSPLGRAADICLQMQAGPETAGVASKTLTCSLVLLDLLAGAPLEVAAAAVGGVASALDAREGWLPALAAALGDAQHIWVLGRGRALAAAMAAGLMLKEAGAVHGEGLSTPQFRHGPLEAAAEGRSALIFVTPGALAAHDLELAGEMAAAGMRVAALYPGEPPGMVPNGVRVLGWPSGEPAALLVGPQLLAHRYAEKRGVVPGTFLRVAKVTTRE